MHRRLQQFLADRRGNIAITACIMAPLTILSAGIGIDYGLLTLQQRDLQATADLAAIAAAVDPSKAAKSVAQHFAVNNRRILVETPSGLLTPEGSLLAGPTEDYEGTASIETGHYQPDPTLAVDARFQPGAQPADAVRVTIAEPGRIYLMQQFSPAPDLRATGTAASQRSASFSIGSRLARVDDGILNATLSALLGSAVSLDLMDYQALLDADVDLFALADQQAQDLHLTALTYDQLLSTTMTYPQLLASLAKPGITPARAASAVSRLLRQVPGVRQPMTLGRLLAMDVNANKLIGERSNLSARMNILSLVDLSAVLAGDGQQLASSLPVSVPGLTQVSLDLAVGAPPIEAPPARIGKPASAVRTAQTRLALTASIPGLDALLGMKIQLPVYVELAHAEAKLVGVTCSAGKPTSVTVDVVPGLAELSIGTVDPAALSAFSRTPRVSPAVLVDSPLLKVEGSSHVNVANLSAKRLVFSAADIASGRIQTVSTRDILTSKVTSLISELTFDVKLLFITVGTQKSVQTAIADRLRSITKPLDDLVYAALDTLGIHVGQVDVRVTAAQCSNPVLVQ